MFLDDPGKLLFEVHLEQLEMTLLFRGDCNVVLCLLESQLGLVNLLLLGFEVLLQIGQLVVETSQGGLLILEFGLGCAVVVLVNISSRLDI